MNAYELIAAAEAAEVAAALDAAGEAAGEAADEAAEDAVARAEIKAKYAAGRAAYAAAQAAAKAECKATAAARAAIKAERHAAEAVMLARRLAIRDRAVIWVEAVGYGRGSQVGLRVDTDAGPYTATALSTAGVRSGRRGTAYNRTSAECYAVLKAVELACECGLKHCVIRNNSIGGFEHAVPRQRGYGAKYLRAGRGLQTCSAYTRRRGPGERYLRLAKKMAQSVGLKVEFKMCACGENLAEAVNYR